MPRPGQAREACGLKVAALGERARRALGRSGGLAHPLPGVSDSPWYEAGGEIVWIGARLPALHPRAVLTSSTPARGAALRLGSFSGAAWSPRLPRLDEAGRAQIVEGANRVRHGIVSTKTPRGFGALLANISPSFPLDWAVPWVGALRDAFERDDPRGALAPARSLLGFGTGLTPSGDDLVGAALFGRRLIAPGDRRWRNLAQVLTREIRKRSHAVSAALFADLSAGRSFAPLHEMADALAAGDGAAAVSAARALVRIGHSSGWDMLAGFLIGICRRSE